MYRRAARPAARSKHLRAGWGLALLGLGCAAFLDQEPAEIAGWRARAESLRGLGFERRVPLHQVGRESLPDLVRAELEPLIEAGYASAYRDAYAALGLLPAGFDLVEQVVRLNAGQIAGFYSLRRRSMYVLEAGSAPILPILVHEAVHALQHQHFPETLELMQGLRRNDDVALALGAAAEGDATLTMLRAETQDGGLRADGLAQERARLQRDSDEPSGRLGEVPRVLRAQLLFPYRAGLDLAVREFRAAGAAGLDRMLRAPPLSTARVRRPEIGHPVEFLRLPVARAMRAAGPRCRAGADNVLGVVGLEVLLAEHGFAGPGLDLEGDWSGDRFVHIACPAGDELLWITLWRTPEAALRFAAAHAGIAESAARGTRLAGVPVSRVRDRAVLVATPGLKGSIDALLEATEVRSYTSFQAWTGDACFPESPCPFP